MGKKAKGRRYKVIKRRLTLQDPLWWWAIGKLSHPKGDPKVFDTGELVKVLKPGSVLYIYLREQR